MSSIDSSSILSAIAKLEGDLAKLKIALGVPDVVVPKASRKSKAVDGEKKAPNVWIRFTQQVDAALKAASISTGAAPVAKQFASALKDIKPYAEWTDETIVAAWATWEKPEQSKMAKAKGSEEEGASDSGSSGTKERKKRAPMTEEAKAAAAEKRAAKKAAAAPAPAAESDSGSATKERKKRAPMTEEAKAAMKAKKAATMAAKAGGVAQTLPASDGESESETETAPAAAVAPPKPTFKAKKVVAAAAPTFTKEQLSDFDTVEIEGVEYGKNVRGDMVDGDGEYIGTWDAATKQIVKCATPADWVTVMA